MLLMALMLIALSIEAPRIRQQIKREKEEELIHRAREYTTAIRRFYRKFGRYPLTIEQLENTNNFRFLRKRYKDPMTGKDDWRLIHQGEAILKVPGSGGALSVNGPQGGGNTFGNPGFSQPTPSPTPSPTPQGPGGDNSSNASGSPAGGSSGSAFATFQPGAGGIIGVAATRKEESIKIINDKDHYNEWEFVYDPRFEQQQQLGGGMNVPNNPNSGQVMGGGGPTPPTDTRVKQ
jgi:type II secretory pathway pseudopilin PulG